MDKYEYKVKLTQIEKLVERKDYITAAKIADGIDWRRVKSTSTLLLIADIYEQLERYEDGYEILNMAYDRTPNNRRLIYRLACMATKMKDFEEAVELYEEFLRVAPRDLNRYLLQYQISRERGMDVTEQIRILEEYKSHEYEEEWSYELACLYEEAGMCDRCIAECDELILWFSEGEYVIKAMELKMKYSDLTATQKAKYEHRMDEAPEQSEFGESGALFGEKILKAMEENVRAGETTEVKEAAEAEETTVTKETAEAGETAEKTETAEYGEKAGIKKETAEEKEKTEEAAAKENIDSQAEESEEISLKDSLLDNVQVTPFNVSKFSTINLQKELAKGLAQVLSQASDGLPDEDISLEDSGEVKQPTKEVIVEEQEISMDVSVEEDSQENTDVSGSIYTEEEPAEKEPIEEEQIEEEQIEEEPIEEGQIEEEPIEEPAEKEPIEEEPIEEGPAEEESIEDKQIPGQMTIEEVLENWEQIRTQAAEGNAQENLMGRRQTVLCETGEITSLLQDVLPHTPKESECEAEDPEETTEAVEAAETVEETKDAETTEAVEAAETVEETEAVEKAEDAEVIEETKAVEAAENAEETEIEDDLPIDLEALLMSSLNETTGETEPEKRETVKPEPEKSEADSAEPDEDWADSSSPMIWELEKALEEEVSSITERAHLLTEEQEKLFAYFTSVRGMKRQLEKLLAEDLNYAARTDSATGNLVISGARGNGKTTLAIDIVKAFQKQRREKGGKLAKITGSGFNKKNPTEILKKLGGGTLIIERAGELKDSVIEQLSEAMEGETCGLLVILEDERKELASIFEKHKKFAAKFNRSIEIPIFTNNELVEFGRSYAEEQEYYFDEMAVLALYNRIGKKQTFDHVVNVTEVKEMIDDAIFRAEKKSKNWLVRLSKKRVDEFGNKLLLEEDFGEL